MSLEDHLSWRNVSQSRECDTSVTFDVERVDLVCTVSFKCHKEPLSKWNLERVRCHSGGSGMFDDELDFAD